MKKTNEMSFFESISQQQLKEFFRQLYSNVMKDVKPAFVTGTREVEYKHFMTVLGEPPLYVSLKVRYTENTHKGTIGHFEQICFYDNETEMDFYKSLEEYAAIHNPNPILFN